MFKLSACRWRSAQAKRRVSRKPEVVDVEVPFDLAGGSRLVAVSVEQRSLEFEFRLLWGGKSKTRHPDPSVCFLGPAVNCEIGGGLGE